MAFQRRQDPLPAVSEVVRGIPAGEDPEAKVQKGGFPGRHHHQSPLRLKHATDLAAGGIEIIDEFQRADRDDRVEESVFERESGDAGTAKIGLHPEIGQGLSDGPLIRVQIDPRHLITVTRELGHENAAPEADLEEAAAVLAGEKVPDHFEPEAGQGSQDGSVIPFRLIDVAGLAKRLAWKKPDPGTPRNMVHIEVLSLIIADFMGNFPHMQLRHGDLRRSL
jgi:hypothetical protein